MVNKVILIGNVGLDPEVRTTEGGVKVARVRLATTERLFDRASNETKEHTEWHTITLWRGLADVVDRFVRKGSQIYIEGRLRTREWMDKDNNKRYTTEILADTMNLLGRRSDNPASDGAPAPSYGAQPQGASYGQQGGYQQRPQQSGARSAAPAAPISSGKERVSNFDPNKSSYQRSYESDKKAKNKKAIQRENGPDARNWDDDGVVGNRKVRRGKQQQMRRPEPVVIEKAVITTEMI